MTTFIDIPSALTAFNAYLISKGDSLSANTQGYLAAYSASPVDTIVNAAESLYAAYASLDASGVGLATGLINLCVTAGWHTIGATARGPGMVAFLTRVAPPLVAPLGTDPAPLAQFAP